MGGYWFKEFFFFSFNLIVFRLSREYIPDSKDVIIIMEELQT